MGVASYNIMTTSSVLYPTADDSGNSILYDVEQAL